MKPSRRETLEALVGVTTLGAASAAVAAPPASAPAPAVDPAAAIQELEKEAFANLKSLFVSQKAYFAEKDRYTTNLDECGFAPSEWCEDGARLKIKQKPTASLKLGCHFVYEVETLGSSVEMQFRAYARGAVDPVLGVNYLVESSGQYAGIPRRNPK